MGMTMYTLAVARQQLGKHVLVAKMICWKRRFLCGPCRIKGKWAINSSQKFLLFSNLHPSERRAQSRFLLSFYHTQTL
jgi:hypothetical protein